MRNRRRFFIAAGLATLAAGSFSLAQAQPRVVRISAKRFTYTPNEVQLKRGEPVILEVVTEDIVMGINIPDFKVRADIIPGQTAKIPLTPDKTGTFVFLCDIFCGDGHESMSGTLKVT